VASSPEDATSKIVVVAVDEDLVGVDDDHVSLRVAASPSPSAQVPVSSSSCFLKSLTAATAAAVSSFSRRFLAAVVAADSAKAAASWASSS
jgi:hypothetical protein